MNTLTESYGLKYNQILALPLLNNEDFIIGCFGVNKYNCLQPNNKLAIFDFDGTIGSPIMCVNNCNITPDNCPCPSSNWDGYREWIPSFDSISTTFENLIMNGYKIIIMSNQPGLEMSRGVDNELYGRDKKAKSIKQKRQDFFDKITELAEICNTHSTIPINFTAVGFVSNRLQKPTAEGFEIYNKLFNGNFELDCMTSFYCGDAAGRIKGDTTNLWVHGQDTFGKGIVNSDQMFSINIGLRFFTPEEVFKGPVSGFPMMTDNINNFKKGLIKKNSTNGRSYTCDWNNGMCENSIPINWCNCGGYKGKYRR